MFIRSEFISAFDLANPNCKLFITHAGCNGLTEALHYAVPMVAIPLFADQPDGAARVAKRGFGVVLHKQDITTESLYTAITTVLNNERLVKFATTIVTNCTYSLIVVMELI